MCHLGERRPSPERFMCTEGYVEWHRWSVQGVSRPQRGIVHRSYLPCSLWPWPGTHGLLCHVKGLAGAQPSTGTPGLSWLPLLLQESNLVGPVGRVGLLAVNIPSGKWISTEVKVKRFGFKAVLEQLDVCMVPTSSWDGAGKKSTPRISSQRQCMGV